MLDLQTLTFASVIATLISTLFFTGVWRLNKNIAGINIWLMAIYSQALGWLLLSLRNHISDVLSIVFSNYLILQSLLLFYLGLRSHLDKPYSPSTYLMSLVIAFIPLQSYFTYLQPDVIPRIVLVYVVSILIMIMTLSLLLNLPSKMKTAGIIMYRWITLVIITVCVIRLTSVTPAIQDLYDPVFSNFVSALIGFILPQGLTLGVFVLAYEKREQSIDALRANAKSDAELKNRYLATLSHELRTPLNGIVGMAQALLDQQNEPTSTSSKLKTIINSGRHLAELANNILEYSAMENNKEQKLNNSTIDARNFFGELKQLVMPLADEKSLSLKITIDDNLPKYITTDIAKLRSILLNLLTNAIKYTDNGYISLNVEVLKSNPKNLTISVSDTGRGLPKSKFDLMTQPFTRGQYDVHQQSGVGLGLAIVQYLLLAMDSKLEWQEKESDGTLLSFKLHLELNDEDSIDLETDYLDIQKQTQPLKILLIEDVELNIEVLTNLLQSTHKLSVAKTGSQALTLLNQEEFDVVLLDMQLPDMSGLDIFQQVKDNNLDNTPKFIALTAAVTPADMQTYQSLDFLDVVEKPIIKTQLINALNLVDGNNNNNAQGSAPCQVFDSSPLSFLVENLPQQQLTDTIYNMQRRFDEELQQLILYYKQNKHEELKSLSHRMASHYGQFGLMTVHQQLKFVSTNPINSATELTKLKTLMQDAYAILLTYYEAQYE